MQMMQVFRGGCGKALILRRGGRQVFGGKEYWGALGQRLLMQWWH